MSVPEYQLEPSTRRRRRPTGDTAQAQRVGWDEFRDWFLDVYKQDEHVSLLGPTNVGKTTLASEILEARECVIVIATKPEDPVVDRFQALGYKVQERLEVPSLEDKEGKRRPHPAYRRVVLWPREEQVPGENRWRTIEQMKAYQRREILRAFDYARRARRWTIFSDDAMYLAEDLQLGNELKWWWRQGRSAKLGLVAAAQRPAWVPRDMYSAPQHLFFWQTNDKNDLERLADIGAGLDRKELEGIVSRLPRHEFLYLRPRVYPPMLLRSKVEV